MENKNIYRLLLVCCMILWGTVGLITRTINLEPVELAFFRAFFALPFLFLYFQFSTIKTKSIKLRYILYYLISGALIGFAWVALFQGYKYTTISTAVLLYNMCPVYVILLSPILLKEKISFSRIVTIAGCFFGLFLLINNKINLTETSSLGILWSIISGILYSIIVIMNRKANQKDNNIDITIITLIQLLGASLILLPFQISKNSFLKLINLKTLDLILLFILATIHTAIAYIIYFSIYKKLQAIEIITYSYLEPLFSILLSVLFLNETLSINQVIGGSLILGFTFFGEYYYIKKNKKLLVAN